jgi:23S rRNA (guanosine2251-2'-O)-methyltransferase
MMKNRHHSPGKPARKPVANESGQNAPDIIWGLNPVREALAHNPRGIGEILVQRGKAGPKYQEIIDLARLNRVRLRFVDPDRFGIPSHHRHQGVVARQTEAQFLPLDDLLEDVQTSASGSFPRILALDSIQDPRNLGAIFRSAAAAGFVSVIITRERSAPISGTVAGASAGAVSLLRISQVANLAESLKCVRQSGFWVFGTVADQAASSVYAADLRVPVCLVIGSEGKGIRPLVQKQCDQLVTIPMQPGFDSLNVSVAAGIVMFEVVRQQGQSG